MTRKQRNITSRSAFGPLDTSPPLDSGGQVVALGTPENVSKGAASRAAPFSGPLSHHR